MFRLQEFRTIFKVAPKSICGPLTYRPSLKTVIGIWI